MHHTGEFELGLLLSRSVPPPPVSRPARPRESLAILSTAAEYRAALLRVAQSAQRLMSIYTPDLEPLVFEQDAFLEILKRFVLARRFAKVRLLVADRTRLMHESNRIVALGRRLSSYVDIRTLRAPAPQRAAEYLIADDRALVYRLHGKAWDGVADYDNAAVARLHMNEFDELWDESAAQQGPVRAAV